MLARKFVSPPPPPFEEKLVGADTRDTTTLAARKRLQSVLDQLNPAAGKTEPEGVGTAKAKKAGKAGKKKLQKAKNQ